MPLSMRNYVSHNKKGNRQSEMDAAEYGSADRCRIAVVYGCKSDMDINNQRKYPDKIIRNISAVFVISVLNRSYLGIKS